MRHFKEFPFERGRRVTAAEVRAARRAIEAKLGTKRSQRGRPTKAPSERYRAISIRLHPRVLLESIGFHASVDLTGKSLYHESR